VHRKRTGPTGRGRERERERGEVLEAVWGEE